VQPQKWRHKKKSILPKATGNDFLEGAVKGLGRRRPERNEKEVSPMAQGEKSQFHIPGLLGLGIVKL
jgi:hypothetical protein